MNNKIKTIFIGTPDFSIPTLISLVNNSDFNILGVITQPDKKVGRQQILTEPPIKKVARSYSLLVCQPEKIKNFVAEIKNLAPDLIIVIAYAQIIPPGILSLPKYGCVNIHGSLLPKYRGASCVPAAIINGDAKTGITIMLMDKNLDTGPIIAQEEIEIAKDETSATLYKKLSVLAGKTAITKIKDYVDGRLQPKPQGGALATLTKILQKDDGLISWQKDAPQIERFIRAMHPWPGAFAYWQGKKIAIIKTENEILPINNHLSGEIFLHNDKVAIQCGHDAIILDVVKLEGKNEMPIKKFINGYQKFVGSLLLPPKNS
jgi:methionyl-tRNA formyltransferase